MRIAQIAGDRYVSAVDKTASFSRAVADPSPSTSPRKQVSKSHKSASKRRAIMRVAIDVINLRSFALATMTEIADRLGLKDAALYYYFPGKQALVYACHVDSMDRFERLVGEVEASGANGLGKVELLLKLFLEDSETNGQHLYFGDHSYLAERERLAIDDWAARLTKRIEKFIKQGIADGSVRQCEPELTVQLILGMLIWLGKWAPSTEGLTAKRLLASLSSLTVGGLRA